MVFLTLRMGDGVGADGGRGVSINRWKRVALWHSGWHRRADGEHCFVDSTADVGIVVVLHGLQCENHTFVVGGDLAEECDAPATHVGVVRHQAVEEARYGGAADPLQRDGNNRASADIEVGEHRQDHRHARIGGGA